MGWLKKLVAIVLIIIAIYFGLIYFFPAFMSSLPLIGGYSAAIALMGATSVGMLAVVALVGAMLIDPETTTNALNKIGEAIGKTGSAIVSGAAAGVAGFLGASPIVWVGLGVLALYLLSGDDDNRNNRRGGNNNRRPNNKLAGAYD